MLKQESGACVSRIAGEFRFLIAFILAGLVARAVAFWCRRRQNYASLCGTARILNVQISALLPIDQVSSAKCNTVSSVAHVQI